MGWGQKPKGKRNGKKLEERKMGIDGLDKIKGRGREYETGL